MTTATHSHPGAPAPPLCTETLLHQLRSRDGLQRMKAREALIRIGTPCIHGIIGLLAHDEMRARWEACKVLYSLRVPETAVPLAQLLMDEEMDVRWVAAEALIELDRHALRPVLLAIEEHFDSSVLREAAHHVLASLHEKGLLEREEQEVLRALRVTELPSKAAFTANNVLEHLRSDPTPDRL